MKATTEFDLGRLYERRETRDQLFVLSKLDPAQLPSILQAWLLETIESLPDNPTTYVIEETYVII